MEEFSYFKEWDECTKRECCELSKIMKFSSEETVLGDGIGLPNYVYFVVEGKCQLIQELKLVKNVSGHYMLYKPSTYTGGQPIERFFIQVCLFTKGQSFGIGENFENRRVVAETDVKCFLCPHYWLMQHNRANIWVRIQRFLNDRIPSTEKIFKSFIEQRKWLRYRKALVQDTLKCRRIPNDTSIYEVPYSIRIKCSTINKR